MLSKSLHGSTRSACSRHHAAAVPAMRSPVQRKAVVIVVAHGAHGSATATELKKTGKSQQASA
jgi:hypothetical protein